MCLVLSYSDHNPPHWSALMLSLNDAQLATVMTAAADVDPDRRSLFLERCAPMLHMRGRRFTDADLIEITKLACTGLVRRSADQIAPPTAR